MKINYKLMIILISTVLFIGIVSYLIYLRLGFFVSNTSPANNSETAQETNKIEISFNKDIREDNVNRILIEPKTEKSISIEKNKVIIRLSDFLKKDQKYKISLYDIKSVSGQSINYYELNFTAVYKNFNQLTKSEQTTQIANTDKIVDSSPLLKSLPHETVNYTLEYSFADNPQKPYYKLTLAQFNEPMSDAAFKDMLRQYKKQAFDYIRSKGEDPTKLDIRYNPPEAKDL